MVCNNDAISAPIMSHKIDNIVFMNVAAKIVYCHTTNRVVTVTLLAAGKGIE